jgi:aspartyl aminopeptidase
MDTYIQDLLDFLDGSPTAVQASGQVIRRLEENGFRRLPEDGQWALENGGKYYVLRHTSVIAFIAGATSPVKTGYQIGASHIDSPSLKIKPESVKTEQGVTRVAVEVYGGPIISTWTDRELGIAGKVAVRKGQEVEIIPVDLKKPVAIIPNAAIHLHREINKGFEYNKQTHLQAILNSTGDAADPLLDAVAGSLGVDADQMIGMELFLYDFAKAALAGVDGSLVVSGRLDNLGMSHAILAAFCEAESPVSTCVAALFDHEEIGSSTQQGADSSLLGDVLERISLAQGYSREEHLIALSKSFLVSGDMAHAYHPSYPEKYDASCSPRMNGGLVIKWNAGYKYASTVESNARFTLVCESAGIKPQKFAMRSDLICGSTVGPIISSKLGIPAVDVGSPLWAMHSVRETAGVHDHLGMIKALKAYYQ